jgi:DNA-binding GntR family transcriptional regulator
MASSRATGEVGGPALDGVEAVHRALRSQILDGSIPSGTLLSQVQLAERFGVSRTPLREALRMLQEEGLIEARSNRQARVVTFALEDLEAISAQRILLSALATKLTVPFLARSERGTMSELLATMDRAAATDDVAAWRAADVAFHAAHCAHAPAGLFQEVRRLAERNALYRLVWLRDQPHRDATTTGEHQQILRACAEGDAVDAARRIARHQARIAIGALAHAAPEHEPRVIRAALQLAASAGPVVSTASPPA